MSFYIRSQWNADNVSRQPMPTKPVKEAYIHHTAFEPSNNEIQSMRNLENSQQASGYSTIAYAEVGFDSGNVYEGRGVAYLGAATKNKNSTSLAYCFFGNFVNRQPSAQALEACAQRLAQWVREGRLTNDFVLRAHSEVFATACPGTNLKNKLGFIRSRTTEILKGGQMSADKLTKQEVLELHRTYFGSTPGAGYDFRHVGGTLGQLIKDWAYSPIELASRVNPKVAGKDTKLVEEGTTQPTPPTNTIDVEAIAEAVAKKLAERLKE